MIANHVALPVLKELHEGKLTVVSVHVGTLGESELHSRGLTASHLTLHLSNGLHVVVEADYRPIDLFVE